MARIILASGSPRRKELLEQIGLEFEVIPAAGEEKVTSQEADRVVEELSRQKAEEVAEKIGDSCAVILGADTVVCQDGQIMGKPKNREEAGAMIESIQGRSHSVFTGVTILVKKSQKETICHTFSCETKVHVYPMKKQEIEDYLETGEAMDKAGAYGIQGRFAAWVRSIEGDYNNVVGLPVSAVWQVLKEYV